MNRGSANRTGRGKIASPCFNEAPIHESGKSASLNEARVMVNASMRPRFMNRGSHPQAKQGAQKRLASMRPRFMNRGSPCQTPSTRYPCQRFNEAPIHESGKCPMRYRRLRRWPSCFNEAPIHESGKSKRREKHDAGIHASMRPRFMNRGSSAVRRVVRAADRASMRPRFMNRGSDAYFDALDTAKIASMRPRFMNRGSNSSRTQSTSSEAASMRPRFMNRGSGHAGAPLLAIAPRASMRPRFMNRGSRPIVHCHR